jgi:hypothetical protein
MRKENIKERRERKKIGERTHTGVGNCSIVYHTERDRLIYEPCASLITMPGMHAPDAARCVIKLWRGVCE